MTKKERQLKKEITDGLKELGFTRDKRPGHFGYDYLTDGYFSLIAWFDDKAMDSGLIRLFYNIDMFFEYQGSRRFTFDVKDLSFDKDSLQNIVPTAKKAIKLVERLNKSYNRLKANVDKFEKL